MWSLLECQLGHFLDTDPYGRLHGPYVSGRNGPIASGWRLVLVAHKGDEKYHQRVYRASHGAVSRNICLLCQASSEQGPLLYTNHGTSAAHRRTLLDTPAFIQRVAGLRTWTALPGWSVQMICHDYLHVVDLTICPEVSASCLIELIEQGVFGPVGLPADERLRRAYCMFIKACRANKVSALSVLIGGLNVVSYMHDTFLTSLDCLQEAGAWFGRCYFDAATNHLL